MDESGLRARKDTALRELQELNELTAQVQRDLDFALQALAYYVSGSADEHALTIPIDDPHLLRLAHDAKTMHNRRQALQEDLQRGALALRAAQGALRSLRSYAAADE